VSETVQIYGLRVDAQFAFAAPLPRSRGKADIFLQPGLGASAREIAAFQHVYSSAYLHADGRPLFELHLAGDRELLRFNDRAEFLFDGPRIGFRPIGAGNERDVEALFLSAVMAYWLERAGVLALHASAAVLEGRAVAFLAPSGGGKSSLAASFAFAGWPILGDDILALTVGDSTISAAPAYPEIKLNPDTGRYHLGADFDRLRRYHPLAEKRCLSLTEGGLAFRSEPVPLGCLYVVAHREREEPREDAAIEPIARRDAVIEIVRSTYTPTLVEGVGLAAWRLSRMTDLVRSVPVKRLAVPRGLDRLSEVREAVLADVVRSD